MGWKSLSTVQYFLSRLRDKGAVTGRSARSIRVLVDPVLPPDAVPTIGRVAAGAPLLSDEHIEATAPADTVMALFRTRPDFFLRVEGESMAGAGIRDGDLVAVRKACDAHDGQIVVACVDGKATLKRLRRDNGHLALVPENSDFDTIVVTDDRFDVGASS